MRAGGGPGGSWFDGGDLTGGLVCVGDEEGEGEWVAVA